MNRADGKARAPLLLVSSDAGNKQVLGPYSMHLLNLRLSRAVSGRGFFLAWTL